MSGPGCVRGGGACDEEEDSGCGAVEIVEPGNIALVSWRRSEGVLFGNGLESTAMVGR